MDRPVELALALLLLGMGLFAFGVWRYVAHIDRLDEATLDQYPPGTRTAELRHLMATRFGWPYRLQVGCAYTGAMMMGISPLVWMVGWMALEFS